jgi:hypothetical protein
VRDFFARYDVLSFVVMRSRFARAAIGLWSAWFAIALSEPASLHDCPMHGSHAMHAAHAAVGMQMDMQQGTAGMDTGSVPDGHHAVCTCFGSCCSASTAALAAAPTGLTLATTISSVEHVAPITRAIRRRAYTQPFANGPPSPTLL